MENLKKLTSSLPDIGGHDKALAANAAGLRELRNDVDGALFFGKVNRMKQLQIKPDEIILNPRTFEVINHSRLEPYDAESHLRMLKARELMVKNNEIEQSEEADELNGEI